jgi:hypothetical protein
MLLLLLLLLITAAGDIAAQYTITCSPRLFLPLD